MRLEGLSNLTAAATGTAALNVSFPLADTAAGSAFASWGSGSAAAVQLYIERRDDAVQPFYFGARLAGDPRPWYSVTAQALPRLATMPSHQPGALWFGMAAKALADAVSAAPPPGNSSVFWSQSAGPASATGVALFSKITIGMTPPGSLPLDSYGRSDVCAAPLPLALGVWTQLQPPDVTKVTVTSLSSSMPYQVIITAVNMTAGGVIVDRSPPAAPIPGAWFFARRMAPYANKLSMWLDSRWLKDINTYLSVWPDQSGNSHHAYNTAASVAQKPMTNRDASFPGDVMAQPAVVFARARGTFMTVDADVHHFGVDGTPKTIYWFGRTYTTSSPVSADFVGCRVPSHFPISLCGHLPCLPFVCPPPSLLLLLQQLVMGRGPISTRFDTTSTGWLFGMQYRSYGASLVFRVGAINAAGGVSIAGGISQHPYTTRLTFSSASMFPVGLTNGSASPRNARSAPFWNVLPAYYNVTTQPYIGPWGMNRALACAYTVSCDSGSERNWQNPAEAVFYPITSSCKWAASETLLSLHGLQYLPAMPPNAVHCRPCVHAPLLPHCPFICAFRFCPCAAAATAGYLTEEPTNDYSVSSPSGDLQFSPPASQDDILHIGGQNYGAANTGTALDGEVSALLVYEGAHSTAQRTAVNNFFNVSLDAYEISQRRTLTTVAPRGALSCEFESVTDVEASWLLQQLPLSPALAASRAFCLLHHPCPARPFVLLQNWYQYYCSGFPGSISVDGTSSSGTCAAAPLGGTCYHTCASASDPFYQLWGTAGTRTCSNGNWNMAPLICKQRCYGAFVARTAILWPRHISASFAAALPGCFSHQLSLLPSFSPSVAWPPPFILSFVMLSLRPSAFPSADVLSPLYSSLCFRRYIDETFNYAADPQLEVKHWVWPSTVPLWERKRLWVIEPDKGTMLGNSSADPCTRKRNVATFYGPVSSMWSTFAPQPNQLVSRTVANISLLTPSSVAGVAVRIQDERNMYLAEVRTRNVTLVRIVGGVRTVLAVRPTNFTMEGGAWGRFSISTQNRQVWVTQDDPTPGSNITATIVNMTDPSPLLTPAGSALYLAPDSLVRFDNFGVDIGCDLGNVVRWAHSGMQVLFSCKPGFTPVGNLTWTCQDGVQNYGSSYLICLSQVSVPVQLMACPSCVCLSSLPL